MRKLLAICLFFFTFSSATLTVAEEVVSLREISPFPYCSIHHKGPFTEIQEVIGKLMQAFQSQNIFPAGPMIGIYYNSPAEVNPEDLDWEVGFPVTAQVMAQAPLEKKQWDLTPVASCLHVGPYEKTTDTISKILDWMKANGYVQTGPVMERYLDMNPAAVKPEELRTEVWIPCQKSKP